MYKQCLNILLLFNCCEICNSSIYIYVDMEFKEKPLLENCFESKIFFYIEMDLEKNCMTDNNGICYGVSWRKKKAKKCINE